MTKLSEYELEREANIARNRALLEQLELKQAVEGLGVPKAKVKAPKITAKPVQPSKRVKRERSESEAPRRQSARLKREVIDPDESPSQRKRREAELEEQRAKEAEARLEAEERERIAKRPRHDELDLETLAAGEAEDSQQLAELSTALQTVAQQPRCVGDPSVFAFDDDKMDEAAIAELREKMQSLKVVSRAKVTQDRVYSAAYHPEVTKDLIFFGDKHGQLGIWDARAPPDEVMDVDGDVTTLEGGKYWRLQLHWPATSRSSISSVKFDPIDSHTVYTGSYDCTVRSLSFTSGVSREILSTDDGNLISSIDLTPSGHEMWVSDSIGGVRHLDLRQDKSKARWYGLSDQKIGSVSVNPTRPHFLLTASNNRSLKIWDTRHLRNITADLSDGVPPTPPASSPGGPSEWDAPSLSTPLEFDHQVVSEYLQTKQARGCLRSDWRHDKAVSSAYWDPRGRAIVSTSYDDALRLWDVKSSAFQSSSPFPSSRPFSRIRHNCQTGKWLTILRAQWTLNPDVYPHFTIGNMDHSLNIFSCKGDLIAKLADPRRVSAVQAVTCSHPGIVERVASGNASGMCILWAPDNIGFNSQ